MRNAQAASDRATATAPATSATTTTTTTTTAPPSSSMTDMPYPPHGYGDYNDALAQWVDSRGVLSSNEGKSLEECNPRPCDNCDGGLSEPANAPRRKDKVSSLPKLGGGNAADSLNRTDSQRRSDALHSPALPSSTSGSLSPLWIDTTTTEAVRDHGQDAQSSSENYIPFPILTPGSSHGWSPQPSASSLAHRAPRPLDPKEIPYSARTTSTQCTEQSLNGEDSSRRRRSWPASVLESTCSLNTRLTHADDLYLDSSLIGSCQSVDIGIGSTTDMFHSFDNMFDDYPSRPSLSASERSFGRLSSLRRSLSLNSSQSSTGVKERSHWRGKSLVLTALAPSNRERVARSSIDIQRPGTGNSSSARSSLDQGPVAVFGRHSTTMTPAPPSVPDIAASAGCADSNWSKAARAAGHVTGKQASWSPLVVEHRPSTPVSSSCSPALQPCYSGGSSPQPSYRLPPSCPSSPGQEDIPLPAAPCSPSCPSLGRPKDTSPTHRSIRQLGAHHDNRSVHVSLHDSKDGDEIPTPVILPDSLTLHPTLSLLSLSDFTIVRPSFNPIPSALNADNPHKLALSQALIDSSPTLSPADLGGWPLAEHDYTPDNTAVPRLTSVDATRGAVTHTQSVAARPIEYLEETAAAVYSQEGSLAAQSGPLGHSTDIKATVAPLSPLTSPSASGGSSHPPLRDSVAMDLPLRHSPNGSRPATPKSATSSTYAIPQPSPRPPPTRPPPLPLSSVEPGSRYLGLAPSDLGLDRPPRLPALSAYQRSYSNRQPEAPVFMENDYDDDGLMGALGNPSPRGGTMPMPPQEHPFHPRVASPPNTATASPQLSFRSSSIRSNRSQQQSPQDFQGFNSDGGNDYFSSVGRRTSRYSNFSSSSNSDASPNDFGPSPRIGTSALYGSLGERPSVSTVFEEEGYTEDDALRGFSDWRPPRRESSEPGCGSRRVSTAPSFGSATASRRKPSTAPSYPHAVGKRTERRSTASNASSQGKKSVGSHPFASVTRTPSPLLSDRGRDRGEVLLSGLNLHTHSLPSLYETYKLSASAPSVPPHQVTLAALEDDDSDHQECPVCCESLSFTFRLPGEKPHVVPDCGHALHEECFVTVYGSVPPRGSTRNIGVCGVCRQPMRVSTSGGERVTGKNKLAAMMGEPDGGQGGAGPSSVNGILSGDGELLNGDDNVEPSPNAILPDDLATPSQVVKVVVPKISIVSEFACVRRAKAGRQIVTAMVTVEVPPAPSRGKYPAPARPGSVSVSSPENSMTLLPPTPPSPPASAHLGMPAPQPLPAGNRFSHVIADLRKRVVNYKQSGLDLLGPLRLFDILKVRKGTYTRDFHVYLFQEALVCIAEEKKSGIRGIFGSYGSSVAQGHGADTYTGGSSRTTLKLKGRIYLRHVHHVVDASTKKELCLALTMETEQEGIDSFMISFQDPGALELWKTTITRLIEEINNPATVAHAMHSTGKVAKMTGSQVPVARVAHALSPPALSPAASSVGSIISDFPPESPVSPECSPPCPGDLAYGVPIAPPHTPVDLVIALSTSAPGANQSANTPLSLKLRLMRSSLQFVLACMGPRDRVSLVVTELGARGVVRRTPFLNPTIHDSRKRLENFILAIGTGKSSPSNLPEEDFEIKIGREEREDIVTAVNVALDVILQRKAKSQLTGLLLISDTADQIKRSLMDLVIARLDAAKVPVHTFGYGKAHDPSPLWMMSNHTNGTYTFVKEWYHLRDSLAGVIGGLTSIAITNMKLRLACQDSEFRVAKIAGTSQAVVSASGRDIDVDLNELRHGEKREILLEFELGSGPTGTDDEDPQSAALQRHQSLSGQSTSTGSSGLGLPMSGLDMFGTPSSPGGDFQDDVMDEVPVVEVDCSFHDPAVGRTAARLTNPVLLTLPVLLSSSPSTSMPSEPSVVRRRMELLASDMITRALLIASRKNFHHATRILRETKRIIETITDHLRGAMPSPKSSDMPHTRHEIATLIAIEGLAGVVTDIDMFLDGLEVNKEMFEMDHRNYASQQATILRTQRSWTVRTPTEQHYATRDVQSLIQASAEFSARN